MPNPLAQELLAPLLAWSPIDRTRRNHGLEHATITLLAQKYRGVQMVGRSTPNGFYLHGNLSTAAVREAVDEALRRFEAGEAHLAVHPNCGTNFVTAGVVAGTAAFLGFAGANTSRARWERLPLVAMLCTLALIFAQPLGFIIQRDVTTSGQMRGLRVTHIAPRQDGNIITHFVATSD